MCDTLYASAPSTRAKRAIFGKNSDRQRNEAQVIQFHTRTGHPTGASIKCTYLTIPQAPRTYGVLLCRPFWSWGAEMGVNEHGVVIGNEGLHTRGPPPYEEALTGMDLVRLALERASSAAEAVEIMTQLLERYGQGGNCGHLEPSYYQNGFLIADGTRAWVLETVDRDWVLEPVDGIRALSNIYSIGGGASRVSSGISDLARAGGWTDDSTPDYAAVIGNPHREHIGQASARRQRSTQLLHARQGTLIPADLISALRDHGPADEATGEWHPGESAYISLCMHAGAGTRAGQTVGSLVCELGQHGPVNWVTATSAPCISLFKPVLMDTGIPEHGPPPCGRFDPRTLWWRHELLHRQAIATDFPGFLRDIALQRDSIEAEFQREVALAESGDIEDRRQVINECWRKADEVERSWMTRLSDLAPTAASAYSGAWSEMTRVAGMSDSR